MLSILTEGASEMGITLPAGAAEAFLCYYNMLEEANAQFNLTGPLEWEDAVKRHFLDSLSPLALGFELLPQGAAVADVGSGAGFPGVPLGIVRPDLRITLIDSLSKRVGFLRTVIEKLSLKAECIHMRAEDAGRSPGMREHFDVVISRAVAPLPVLLELLMPLCRVRGRCVAYKGPGLEDELEAAQNAQQCLGGAESSIYKVKIPGTDWNHRILSLDKLGHTPPKFPRKAGLPAKSPL